MRDERRCTAMSKRSRQRCKRAAILGHHVCPFHSGNAPQVKRAASERIAALVDPALNAMSRALKSKDMGAVTRAAADILNRAGVRADTITSAQMMSFVHAVTALFLEVVEDPHLRRQFREGLRRKLPGGADLGMPLDPPAAPPVEPRSAPLRLLPPVAPPEAPEPRPTEIVL